MVRFCGTFLTATEFLLERISTTDQNGSWNSVGWFHVFNMKNTKKIKNSSKKRTFKPGAKKRENKRVVMFDDKHRQ